jgi:formylglycine-generating enzyme required for sulfatase activity
VIESSLCSDLSPELQKLIAILNKLGLTGREIAETIWLATQTARDDVITIDVVVDPPLEEVEAVSGTSTAMILQDLDRNLPATSPPPSAEIVPLPLQNTSSLALPPNYKPIPIPDAPAISQALLLARALQRLARKVSVGMPAILDEPATVNSIAETGLWQPVLRPASELWLDVALVFDTSPSMCLWQRLGFDIHRLLSRYGKFRNVHTWRLRHTAGKVELIGRHSVPSRPQELFTGDRRRLVVIVSDCVAPAWHNGNMRQLIGQWSARLPTVVFQVFPERLWSRTALVRSVTVELQGKREGMASDDLKPFVRSVWDRERLATSRRVANVRLPVVTLEADALAGWAKMVAGDRRARTLGIVWDAQPVTLMAMRPPVALKDRIDAFLLMSSPISRDLAGLLVSAPVITLPIMRLIKRSMLPQASAVHMAEVLMSGLLKVSGSQVSNFENAERIVYEPVDDEVRDRLRAGFLVGEAFDVFEQVSQYIAEGLGRSVNEFWALLRMPGMGASSAETEFLDAFATVSAKVLRGLGGEFEAIANSLATPLMEPADSHELTDLFPLEDIEYEFVTITAVLDRFDFETAQIRQETSLFGLRNEWKIDRRSSFTWGYTESLSGETVGLDMIAIPGGSFLMGAPADEPDGQSYEKPQHEVMIKPFYLGRYPITQAQWQVVAGYKPVKKELNLDPSRFKGDNLPIESISWEDAQEFCQRLSVKTGKTYRLPSEAEWEYACRAGTITPFHFGETISPELANYDGNETYNNGSKGENRSKTTMVGSFPANDWGLHDMHGNVWERCEDDWHSGYEGAPTDGNAWTELDRLNTSKMVRGGSWLFNPFYCRSAYRNSDNDFDSLVGFRVVCGSPRILLSH